MLNKFVYSIFNCLPIKIKFILRYFKVFREFPNLKKPENFNEKVLHRVIFENNPIYSKLADKYEVRKYIESTVGKEYLVPLLYFCESAECLNDLYNWNNIVIKSNHGAGMVKVIEDSPSEKEKELIIKECNEWLNFDYGKYTGERHYSAISRKIIVEKRIEALEGAIKDYKFHRFLQEDGSFKQILQVISGRGSNDFVNVFYDLENLNQIIHSSCGANFNLSKYEKIKIKEISSLNIKICPDIGYVRLDWYITPERIYFGEVTLTPACGLSRSMVGEFGEYMGQLWVK